MSTKSHTNNSGEGGEDKESIFKRSLKKAKESISKNSAFSLPKLLSAEGFKRKRRKKKEKK
jgi:hypothetical protein